MRLQVNPAASVPQRFPGGVFFAHLKGSLAEGDSGATPAPCDILAILAHVIGT
jgi:hypothetical protein